ncbi:MAG: DUF4336 domain-containing protein [Rhodospirillales bacterium]|nr:DUF4336 domain-containing protein [Rhodospirillales bacterium]
MVAEERTRLKTCVDDTLYVAEYPIRYAGCDFLARMTLVRLADGALWLHSPGTIDGTLKAEIDSLGPVRFVIGPGNFHWLHLGKALELYPDAKTYICPGIERKDPTLKFDEFLGDQPPPAWAGEIDQVLVRGTRFIWEVAFFHRPSKTLILTDLVENIGDSTPGVGIALKLWWKVVFRMWNKARPAPEYQLGWGHKKAVRASLEKIMEWDFERVILSHGEPIDADAKNIVREAWRKPLAA